MMKDHCKLLASFNLPDECPSHFSVVRLTGDASTRSYFRITTPETNTLMLMKMPEPFRESDSPYLQNYRVFRDAGLLLAEVYYVEPELGFVFLQDLGDLTFHEAYPQWSEQNRLFYFLQAIDGMQRIEIAKPFSDLSFDAQKFLWELEYFREHFLEGLLQANVSADEQAELRERFRRLATELSDGPRVFCHRDYHSRNLMLHHDRMYVIDFQDARFGPTTYDLASLCYDSYIQHAPEFLKHLESIFFARHPDAPLQRYEYPRMCLQRNLKALGTFGFQTARMGRDFYRQFTAPTLAHVARHLTKLPEYRELGKLLARHIPELAD